MTTARTKTTRAAIRRTQSQRTAESRDALLTATLDVLREVGYAQMSVAEVCSRAERSVGSHLHHFGTKSALVSAAVDHLAALRIRAMREELGRTPREGAAAAADVAWSFYAGPTFVVALELWVAARTDAELRRHLLPVEESIDREVMALAIQIAPTLAADPQAGTIVRLALATMRGLAMRRCLYTEEDLDRTWLEFRPILLQVFDAQ